METSEEAIAKVLRTKDSDCDFGGGDGDEVDGCEKCLGGRIDRFWRWVE